MVYRIAKKTVKAGTKGAFYGAIAMSKGPKAAGGVYLGYKGAKYANKKRKRR